ncbi:MAG TPA: alkaline phosphatase family protein [Longimicrobiales bacterium]|nr:alkaline phosphatase family protein [Longimicrobiales bacterium]
MRDGLRRLRHRLYRFYYGLKYLPFAAERRARASDGRRGFVGIQIDALAHEDLERALRGGHMPHLQRLITRDGWNLRRYPSGLPSATPAVQAAFFHGTRDRIPGFRFYEKASHRVIIGSQPRSMQFIRDRLPEDGVLRGGSSYVNLYDGGARRAAFTLSVRERKPFFEKMGGLRMLLLVLLNPIRVLRMALAGVLEFLRGERDRLISQLRNRATYYWWYLPLLHIGSNVLLRELQTLAVLLDVYTGVPAIFTTYNAYDEFAHHFGPSSRTAMKGLRALDRRIGEILRLVRRVPGRPYDVFILSDHGQTPSVPYRVRYGETLGDTLVDVANLGVFALAETGDYAPPTAAVDFLATELEEIAITSHQPTRGLGLRIGRWLRRYYGIFPLVAETVRVDTAHDLVVTYSSSLAHLYWTEPARPLTLDDVRAHPDRHALYAFLLAHHGIGLVLTRLLDGVHAESHRGRALIPARGDVMVLSGEDPLKPYVEDPRQLRALFRLARMPNAGDLVLFGDYDPDTDQQVCFDDQVGAHGALGGRQSWPFILSPPGVISKRYPIDDPLDLHPVFDRYPLPENR